jgi:hypothetical protein
MHKITSRKLTEDDFTKDTFEYSITGINNLIEEYSENKSPEVFNQIVSNLPSGYMKWMGISTNYLQLKTIYNQRRHHKLTEWQEFCDFIETLPMGNLITGKSND